MSTNYSPKTVTDSLIILFDAGNSKSYPGTGTSWFDLAGGNTGTFGGGSNPTYNSLGGGSILFDGANYYQTITCSDTISHRPNQSFSYEIWSYFNSFTGYDKILLGKPGCNVGLMEINGTMYMSVVGPNGPCQGGSTSAAATAAITAGVWTHWVGTYNVGTGVILYKNGQPVSTASFTGTLGDWAQLYTSEEITAWPCTPIVAT